jgi:hypothetical protein
MKMTTAIAMLSIIPMMLVGCGTTTEVHHNEADRCVWVDTPEDVLVGYEWVGEVLDEEADPEVALYLHCWTGNHPAH